MDTIDELLAKVNDIQRQLKAIQRLDVNPPATSVAKYSGTPVAGNVAGWSGAGTIVDAGYGTATVTRYSGAPAGSALTYWTGAGTVTGGSIAYSNAGTPILAATSSAGWGLEDDGGNRAISIADSGNVLIGLAGSAAAALEVATTATATTRGVINAQHNTGAQAALAYFRKSRGTRTTPTIVSSGDFIGVYFAQVYDGGAYITPAGFGFKVNGATSSGTVPVDLIFAAGAVNDTSLTSEVLRFTGSNGYAGFNQSAPAAQVDILQSTLGNAVQQLASTATNDDPNEIVYQNRVATTNATVTTLHTFTLASNTTYTFDVWVTARRTTGSGVGAANDGAGVHMNGTYKGMTGTATIVGALTVVSSNLDTSMAAVTMTVSGATVLVRVTGTTSNTVVWHLTARVNAVSS